MTSPPIIRFLASLPLCAGMTRRELAAFAAILEPHRFPAGTKIIRQGDAGTVFYLLRSGRVGVFRSTLRDELQRVTTLTPGEPIGHLCLLDGEVREATCIADEPVLLLMGTKRRFDACFDQGESFAFKLLDNIAMDLCSRLKQASEAFYQFYAQPELTIKRLKRLAREVARQQAEEASAVRFVRLDPDRRRHRQPEAVSAR